MQHLPFLTPLFPCAPLAAGTGGGDGCQLLEGHLATDINGDLLLCLLSKAAQRVTALRLPPPAVAAAAPVAAGRRVEVAFSLPALAVAAVGATLHCGSEEREGGGGGGSGRPPAARDLLVLQPDGRLGLYAGGRRLCSVAVPQLDGSNGSGGVQLGAAAGAVPLPHARLMRSPDASCSGRQEPLDVSSLSQASGGGNRPASAGGWMCPLYWGIMLRGSALGEADRNG